MNISVIGTGYVGLVTGASNASIHFIAVGTPPDADSAADLQFVLEVAKQLGETMTQDYNVVVDKSTVPVGTADKFK